MPSTGYWDFFRAAGRPQSADFTMNILAAPPIGSTRILGISAFYHDSAAALVVDGQIVAAAQEERFTRVKHDHRFPIKYCLREGRISPADLDYVGFYDKPLAKFDRLIETYVTFAPQSLRAWMTALPLWLKSKLHLQRKMDRAFHNEYRGRYVFADHHESHAASAFFPSPYEEVRHLHARRRWRMVDLDARMGTSQSSRADSRDSFPSFARSPLQRLHPIHRFSRQFWRV
jgi:hypothetical protein